VDVLADSEVGAAGGQQVGVSSGGMMGAAKERKREVVVEFRVEVEHQEVEEGEGIEMAGVEVTRVLTCETKVEQYSCSEGAKNSTKSNIQFKMGQLGLKDWTYLWWQRRRWSWPSRRAW
jgi:hypothetical protein